MNDISSISNPSMSTEEIKVSQFNRYDAEYQIHKLSNEYILPRHIKKSVDNIDNLSDFEVDELLFELGLINITFTK